jgi:hypothetical protein
MKVQKCGNMVPPPPTFTYSIEQLKNAEDGVYKANNNDGYRLLVLSDPGGTSKTLLHYCMSKGREALTVVWYESGYSDSRFIKTDEKVCFEIRPPL